MTDSFDLCTGCGEPESYAAPVSQRSAVRIRPPLRRRFDLHMLGRVLSRCKCYDALAFGRKGSPNGCIVHYVVGEPDS